ncbi:MAG: hypothetical protein QNI87_13390 [Erythrobacter sp.]|uniref:hypothetical protein n=1 Tax=Erythrobacter sp. TaxID=1042 RepID=UPI002614959C|nr:hypothetical protein [Erythrobacter sp.]MDJ0979515.1 hypothetical protein [Erythrobacter sp.]
MDTDTILLQFGGSLIAILALAGLATLLRLGGRPSLSDETAVTKAAGEVEDGFETSRVSIARDGAAALARDPDGRIMVIKRHGNKYAGRVLTPAARGLEEVDALVVDTGETRFGPVRLSVSDAPYWADAINRL